MLIGNELVNQLRNLCDKIENRLWIISPFIGSWKGVEKIIGTKWMTDTKIDVRLLTDIANEGFNTQKLESTHDQATWTEELADCYDSVACDLIYK